MQRHLRVLRVVGPLALANALLTSPAWADDPATVGARIVTSYTGGASTNAAVATLQTDVIRQANGYLTKLGSNGAFSDINYSTPPGAAWGVGSHFGRVLVLAQAYNMPGSLYHSASLLADIENALAYGTGPTYYCGAASCVTGNWWFWQIGVPLTLGPTLILMKGAIPAATIAAINAKMAYHVGTDAAMLKMTGQNELWVAIGHLYVAVVGDSVSDAAPIVQAATASAAVNAQAFGDGIKPDESYQFHGGQLYTGGYGSGFASNIMTFLATTSGTVFGLPSAVQAQALDYIANGSGWCVFQGHYDPAVRGRDITRPGSGVPPLEAFVPAALASSPLQPELQAMAKMLVAEEGTGNLDVVLQSQQVAALNVTGAFPSGHRVYPSSDYTVHRRSDSFMSIKMLSSRTRSGELVNGEGLQGARQSDGKMYLTLSGTEYLGGPGGVGLWPAMDWSRLPGITVEQNGSANSTNYGVGTEAFVGGTGDGQDGVSAMVLAPIGTKLTANKSWFFFEGYTVFLANAIATADPYPVETIVNQWPLSSASAPVVVDGTTVATGTYRGMPAAHWIEADGIGYFFPGGTTVTLDDETRTGNWSGLGASSGNVTAPFLTIALEHGTAPTDATASYAIAYGGQTMATFAATPPFTVVENDAKVSAVAGAAAAGAVFWVPGGVTVNGTAITTDTPDVVWLTETATTLTVSVADPAQGTGALHITVSGDFAAVTPSDSSITGSLTASGASLTVPRAGGVTHAVTLALQAPDAATVSSDGSTAGGDGSMGDGSMGDGSMGDDGSTGDGSTGDGSTGDGSTGEASSDGASKSGCGCRAVGAEGWSTESQGAAGAALLSAAAYRRRRRRPDR
jgi:hypothetical protein